MMDEKIKRLIILSFLCCCIVTFFFKSTLNAQNTIAEINVGSNPNKVEINPITDRIYVSNGENSVSVIDGNLNQVIDTIDINENQTGTLGAIAVNPETNRIYLVNDGGIINVVDGKTNLIIDSIAMGFHLGGIAVNHLTNTIYVSHSTVPISTVNNRRYIQPASFPCGEEVFFSVSAIDGNTNEIIDTLDIEGSSGLQGLKFNSVNNSIYVAAGVGCIGGVITIIDSDTNEIVNTVEVGDAAFVPEIVINNITNLIYFSRREFTDSSGITISVIDGEDNRVIDTITVNDFLSGWDINSTTNRLYGSNCGKDNISVIDGDLNKVIGTIPAGDCPAGIGINSDTNLIYIANSLSGEITVIHDDGTGIPTPVPSQTPPITPPPEPTPPDSKLFTFACDQNFDLGPRGLKRLVLDLSENENCILKLTNFESDTSVVISTNLRSGFRSSININPTTGTTDGNGELEFTISAIQKGTAWVAWAISNEQGEFEFSKDAYDEGLAWGLFVEVK